MISRLLQSVDFERVLRTRSRASTPHFALHHVPEAPSVPLKRIARLQADAAAKPELSTATVLASTMAVDESGGAVSAQAPATVWLGAIVPKRHARRAVTRTLLKRQIRLAVDGQAASLARGLWVVRLRAPFARDQFISAASDALKRAARDELASLLAKAVVPRHAPAPARAAVAG